MMSVGYLPWDMGIGGLALGPTFELQLKLSAIYHSKIIVTSEPSVLDRYTEIIANEAGLKPAVVRPVFTSIYQIDGLEGVGEIAHANIHPVDGHTWDSKGKIRAGLRGAVYAALANESQISVRQVQRKVKSSRGWIKEAAAIAVSATGSAEGWRRVNQVYPCNILCFNEADAYAAKSRITTNASPVTSQALKKIEAAIPSSEDLGWDHVFELRKSKHILSFRDWLGSPENVEDRGEIIDGLWSAFGDVIENPRTTHLKGLISNLPLPLPINPASIALAARDSRKAVQFHASHGTSVFFYDLWRLTSSKSTK
jgi:hypothetical protein